MQKSYGSYLIEPDSLVEVLPLAIGNQWQYGYYWYYQSGNPNGTGNTIDTGTVDIKIIDKVEANDSTRWIVQENFNLWKQNDGGAFIGPTSYIDTLELIELYQGRHKLYTDTAMARGRYIKSIFPFPLSADTVVYRYDTVDTKGMRTFISNNDTHEICAFSFKQGIGLVSISIDDGCTCMWGFYGHHTLRSMNLTDVLQEQTKKISMSYYLAQNYPNPFNPSTTIQFSIPVETMHASSARVTLKVYDVLGREVVTLVNETKQPGNYEVKFEGANLPSGVYFYKLQAGDYMETKKMMLLR
jgi:hypothetical protein